MSFLGSLRAVLPGLVCAVTLVAGPATAAEVPPCDDVGISGQPVTCIDDGTTFSADDFNGEPGIPAGFIAMFVLVVLLGVGITVWKVVTARDLARQSGMDPGVATGMTLLDENGLSATYLASSLRTARPAEAAVGESTAVRLTELKGLLEAGLITQAEYDERRAEIIDSV